jgi:general secretion pathway protein I
MGAPRERGFTLIEVVVAFVLLSLVLATSFQIFTTGLARAGALDDRSRALAVAQSQLSLAGMDQPLKEGESRGETEDRRFRWTTTITPSDDRPDPSRPVQSAFALFHVAVRVDWQGPDQHDHSLALATLGLGMRQ